MKETKEDRSGREKYSFKAGQELYLDDIYSIQGLAGGDWWEHKEDEGDIYTVPGDVIIITRNVTISISWKKSNVLLREEEDREGSD
jgi:hypothetical protein